MLPPLLVCVIFSSVRSLPNDENELRLSAGGRCLPALSWLIMTKSKVQPVMPWSSPRRSTGENGGRWGGLNESLWIVSIKVLFFFKLKASFLKIRQSRLRGVSANNFCCCLFVHISLFVQNGCCIFPLMTGHVTPRVHWRVNAKVFELQVNLCENVKHKM